MGEISIKDLAQLIALFVSAGALVWAVWSYVEKVRLDHYTEIDRIYSDIVKLRITHTHLAIPPLTLSRDVKDMDEKELRYDAYAFLIWNFIETIHDRCKADRKLLETWRPILQKEGERHAEWLSLNLGKFKESFRGWASRTITGVDKFVDHNGNARSVAAT